jgi:hypothetical protein
MQTKNFKKNTVKFAEALGVILFSLASASAVAADILSETKDKVEKKAYEILDKERVVVKFDPGSSVLSEAASTELKNTLNAVRDNSKLKDIVIVAYSDSEYPRIPKKDLPKTEKDLALRRAEIVENKLKDFGASQFEIFNMAEKSDWFDKTFSTKEATVKRESQGEMSDKGEDLFYKSLANYLKKGGMAGKVVVVFRSSDSVYAH